MAKGKSKSKGKKARKGKTRGGKGGGGAPSGVAAALVRRVCGLTDPFCDHAVGAKLPETSSVPTICVPVRYSTVLGTTAAGKQALAITPAYPYNWLSSTSITGTAVGWGSDMTTVDTTWDDIMSEYRVVSSGVRITYVGAPLYASGRVIIASSDTIPLSGTTDLGARQNFAQYAVVAASTLAEKPMTFFFAPDAEQGRMWQSPNVSDAQVNYWNAVMILCDGLPASSTAAIQVEFVMHIEFRVATNTAYNQLARPSAPFNPQINAMVQNTNSRMPPFIQGTASAVEKAVQHVAYDAIRTAGSLAIGAAGRAIGGWLGGPAGAIAGGSAALMITDQD